MPNIERTAQALDPFWNKLRIHLSKQYGRGARLVLPHELHQYFPLAVDPANLGDARPNDFSAVVLHKGDFKKFPPDFLCLALARFVPTFANEVFVVVAQPGQTGGMHAEEKHTHSLVKVVRWARRHASPETLTAVDYELLTIPPDELLEKLARLIVSDLVKPIPGTALTAIAETSEPFNGTDWFWIDDTGKVAEMFCLPQLNELAPRLAERLIDTLIHFCDHAIIHRRLGAPTIRLEDRSPASFRIINSFGIVSGNLAQGEVYQSVRYNDGRTRPLVCHAPGTLFFTWRGVRHRIDLARAIVGTTIVERGDEIEFGHTSRVCDPNDPRRDIATVTFVYTVSARRTAMALRIEVRPARFVVLTNVVVESTLDRLAEFGGHDRVNIVPLRGEIQTQKVPAENGSGGKIALLPGANGRAGQASYVCVWESGAEQPGHAIGCHVSSGFDGQPFEASCTLADSNRFATLILARRQALALSFLPLRVQQDRLVTAGGYYTEAASYVPLTRETPAIGWCRDPSVSYDIGAELNAVATYLWFANKGKYGQECATPEKLATMKAWFDHHLALYRRSLYPRGAGSEIRVFVRGLAFAALAVDAMDRAFPDDNYRDAMCEARDALLACERIHPKAPRQSVFTNGLQHDPTLAELDCQVAAMLALARIACSSCGDDRISDVIARSLRAIRIERLTPDKGGRERHGYASLVIGGTHSRGQTDNGYWTFKLGLALRAFDAIRSAQDLGGIVLDRDTLAILDRLTKTARQAVAKAAVCREETIEILTSVNSGETNSETQPWVALGLNTEIDRLLMGAP